jgi:DNA-binding NtrC family response regulator
MAKVNLTLADMADKKVKLEDVERAYVLMVLNLKAGNKTHTAKALGIGLRTLQRKLLKWECEAYEMEHTSHS